MSDTMKLVADLDTYTPANRSEAFDAWVNAALAADGYSIADCFATFDLGGGMYRFDCFHRNEAGKHHVDDDYRDVATISMDVRCDPPPPYTTLTELRGGT